MKNVCKAALLAGLMTACCACNAWPQFFKAADDIATDTAIKIEISKECVPSGSLVETDIKITPPAVVPPPPPPPFLPKSMNGSQG